MAITNIQYRLPNAKGRVRAGQVCLMLGGVWEYYLLPISDHLQLRKLSESDTANFSVVLFQTLGQSGPGGEDKDT